MATVIPAPPEGCPPGFTYQPSQFVSVSAGLGPRPASWTQPTCFRSDEGSFFEDLGEGFEQFSDAYQDPNVQAGFLKTAAFAASAALSGGVAPFFTVGQELLDIKLPPGVQTAVTAAVTGAPTVNGNGFFSDLFGDIGAFFTTEQTFGETLQAVGSDIWQGAQTLLPQVALPIAQTFLPAAPRTGQPRTAIAPTPRNPLQYFLPEFMRPSGPMQDPGFQRTFPPFTGVPPGSAPPGQWELDTYGEPGTMGGPMAAGGVMLPAVRSMGTLALQATVNAMRSQGLAASVSWLAGVIRKFGPAAAVGFLASWVEDQIAQRAVWEAYSHKRRRMNPANVKALRRSLRRVGSFDRLCKRVKACKKSYSCA